MPEENSDPKMGEYYKDLPISYLIGAPLKAVCESQVALASAAYDFMIKIGFATGDDGKPSSTPRLLTFDLERPVETPTALQVNKVTVQAPFLGLVPIPALLIEDVSIEFQMEVTATHEQKDKTEAGVELKGGYHSPIVNVDVTGKVTTARENTRNTNQTAKYQVHVNARQQPPTEGLARLMDILATCTAPLKVTAGKPALPSGE